MTARPTNSTARRPCSVNGKNRSSLESASKTNAEMIDNTSRPTPIASDLRMAGVKVNAPDVARGSYRHVASP